MSIKVTWVRKGGYQINSKFDKRFSAFNAVINDKSYYGYDRKIATYRKRTIEEIYQCDIKGYDPKGTNWRLGKGKPPLDTNKNLLEEYTTLWRVWCGENRDLVFDLVDKLIHHDYVLGDIFASTEVNQANALSIIINDTDWIQEYMKR